MCFLPFFKSAPPTVSWDEAMEALGQAETRLEGELETTHTGRAAVLVRSGAKEPDQARAELERALGMARDGGRWTIESDETGHFWVLAHAASLKELASTVRLAGNRLMEASLGERIVAAVFPLRWQERRQYWIFRQKLRRFTPFVPMEGSAQERDHPLEVRMEAALRRDLPIERDVSEWYPIWGMPV